MTITYENGKKIYKGNNFTIALLRYSDPRRQNLARNAAMYVGSHDFNNIKRPLQFIKEDHGMYIFKAEYATFDFVGVQDFSPLTSLSSSNFLSPEGNSFTAQYDFLTLGESLFKKYIWKNDYVEETTDVVRGMFYLVHNEDPVLWNTFYEINSNPSLEWSEVRQKIKEQNLTIKEFAELLQSKSLDISSKPLEEVLKDLYGRP